MRKLSTGQQWEDHQRRKQEAESWDREAQRAAASQAIRDQVESPHFPLSGSTAVFPAASRPEQKPHHGPRQTFNNRYARDVSELATPDDDSPPQYRQQYSPPTPPASTGEEPSAVAGFEEQIRYLKEEVIYKEREIRRLESDLEDERVRRLQLQVERHDAIDAQRRGAEDSLDKLRAKVNNVEQLLDVSIKREEQLESGLDAARLEVRDLKKQLHERDRYYESDSRARETQERRRINRRLDGDNTRYATLDNEMMRSDQCPVRDGMAHETIQSESEKTSAHDMTSVDIGPSDTVPTDAPSQAQGQRRKSTSGKAYVSVPKKNGNRRRVYIFT